MDTYICSYLHSYEGCGFDPRLGLRNHFLSIELEDHLSTLETYTYI